MSEAAVQLKVAGQIYRVVTSASASELTRLAEKVEETLYSLTAPGRQPSTQALVLAAIAIAHELEEERQARKDLEERYHAQLTDLLARIDGALATRADIEVPGASQEAEVVVLAKRTESGSRSFER